MSQIRKAIQLHESRSIGKEDLHGCYLGVDATDPGDEKICFSEVKEGRKGERRHRGCSIDF